jgi:hypothetical protein
MIDPNRAFWALLACRPRRGSFPRSRNPGRRAYLRDGRVHQLPTIDVDSCPGFSTFRELLQRQAHLQV